MGYEREILQLGLSDQHPVEWIVVMQGKVSRCVRVPGRNPEFRKVVRRDLIVQMFCAWVDFAQASSPILAASARGQSFMKSGICKAL